MRLLRGAQFVLRWRAKGVAARHFPRNNGCRVLRWRDHKPAERQRERIDGASGGRGDGEYGRLVPTPPPHFVSVSVRDVRPRYVRVAQALAMQGVSVRNGRQFVASDRCPTIAQVMRFRVYLEVSPEVHSTADNIAEMDRVAVELL